MVIFGERLRQLRTAKGLSQMEFAKQIHISKSSVNMYERGEREPSFETLETIADYFNVDMDFLLGKTDIVRKIHVNNRDASKDIQLSATELELIQKFRRLDARGRSAVMNVLNYEYTSLAGDEGNPLPKQA